MAEEETKKIEPVAEAPLAEAPDSAETVREVAEEKALVPVAPEVKEEPEALEDISADKGKADDSKAVVVAKVEEKKMLLQGSINRDAVLAQVSNEKKLSFIRAWEESEKSKAENKAQNKLSAISVWENSKKATLEAELKKIEEQLEKKKADYLEKVKNQIALIHKAAEEKRATIEAQRGVELLKAEEIAAKHRATGSAPKKLLGFF